MNGGNASFLRFPIISSLPEDLKISTIESYENHIYIGTEDGELIHYFEIESKEYIMISRIKFDEDCDKRIDKIILLLDIERAIVQCDGQIVLFLLPEFAPMPNTTRLSQINDVVLFKKNRKHKSYRILLFMDDCLKMLKLKATSNLEVTNTFTHFRNIKHGVPHENILMVSKSSSYEIINLTNPNNTIPLFRISEQDNTDLEPIILDLNGEDQFLVCSGGGSLEDNSMALIVNHQGDIVQGTNILEHYPKHLIVNFPFLLVEYYHTTEIKIYNISDKGTDDDNNLEQIIQSTNEGDLKIFQTTNNFRNSLINEEKSKYIVNKLRMAPLDESISDSNIRVETELRYIDELYRNGISTSILLNDANSLFGLLKEPIFTKVNHFNESGISEIKNYLDNCREFQGTRITKFDKLQERYLILLYLLLLLLHCKEIDREIIETWCTYSGKIDINILFFLFDMSLHTELMVFNGLRELTLNLKSLKLVHKCENENFIFIILTIVKEKIRKESLPVDTIKTIDINYFMGKKQLEGPNFLENFSVDEYSDESLDNIIKWLLTEEANHKEEALLKIYDRKNMPWESLEILRRNKYKPETVINILEFLKLNFEKLLRSKNYNKETLLEDLVQIIKNSPENEIIKQCLQLSKKGDISLDELLSKFSGDETHIKVLLLEQLGTQKTKDMEFLTRYYIMKLCELFTSTTLNDLLTSFTKEYKDNLSYEKIKLKEFLCIKMKNNLDFEEFLEYYNKILGQLGKNEQQSRIIPIINIELEKIDKDGILKILLYDYGTADEELRFDTALLYNDFQEVEKLTNKNNFLIVFKKYCNELKSIELMKKLMGANMITITKNREILLQVFKEIPRDLKLIRLQSILLNVTKELYLGREELEIKKLC
ncbi:hypothetical protein KAFR_0A08160 [Kazachstania africana CBS 2517]|uniref:CNH domain-containing protein n=1 Tax=Kazachstania africana (strain ATCC 22294 / BCRC 22015 / CBS 2517 / CECT 1963 / NBRC 1671 / NRRL Y-8276) TaxID=1071382 RepID=H2APF0_KAZAF|nr:hypothetical protein KAFR_0A08160 [Kazachstania africana CBS 2517]CCF56250.1 hypothetical protein KAFR_0A08160 [Kazachstania africana CBS 2517]